MAESFRGLNGTVYSVWRRKYGNLARCIQIFSILDNPVVPEFLINFKFLLASITISSSESLPQKINTLVLMSPTWPGGWGWAWTGWPAGTGSGSPCPGAAPASWRWIPGPAEEGECHQNMRVGVIQYLDKMLLRRQSPSTANTSIADGGHGGCWESENYVRMMTRQGGSLYLFVKPYSQSPKNQSQTS